MSLVHRIVRLGLTLAVGIPAALAAGSEAACPGSDTAVFYSFSATGEVAGGEQGEADSLTRLCLLSHGYELTERQEWVGLFDDDPTITLSMWLADMNDLGYGVVRTRATGPHGDSGPPYFVAPSPGGDVAVEYYASQPAADSAALDYIDNPALDFETGDLWVTGFATIVGVFWTVNLTHQGMERHLDRFDADAVFHGEFCYGIQAAASIPFYGSILGYGSQCDVYGTLDDRATIYRRLLCEDYPTYESVIGDAVEGLAIQLAGETENWIHCNESCRSLETSYRNVAVHDEGGGARAVFQTFSERGTTAHVVRGFRSRGDYPARPDTLAVIAAGGSEGAISEYGTPVPSGYALYDIVERELGGRGVWSEPVERTAPRVGAVGGAAAGPATDDDASEERAAFGAAASGRERVLDPAMEAPRAGSLHWLRGGALVPHEGTDATPRAIGKSGAGDGCPDCADAVVFTTWDAYDQDPSFLTTPRDSLVAQGVRVATAVGENLWDARLSVIFVQSANEMWNIYSGGDYPVDPGPTLVIVGDAWPNIVYPWTFPDNGQCEGALCHSYAITTDIDGDSIPDCPVELIPASTGDEVRRLVAAGADVTRGRAVDSGRRVLLVGGDRAEGGVSPWVASHLAETASGFESIGMSPRPPILESDFPIGDIAGLQTATRDAINGGVAEAWLYGLLTDEEKFPGWCIGGVSAPPNLTTRQRIVLWAPGCRMGAVYWPDNTNYGQPPTIEKLSFNDATKTIVAGGVLNLDPGYSVKHRPWATILRNARLNAGAGTPVSRVHYDALRDWYAQFPGDNYPLSTVAIGCRVVVADARTAIDSTSEGDASASGAAAGSLLVAGNVGTQPTFRFALARASSGSLRIIDASGRTVATLREGTLPAGSHQLTWFGVDRAGRPAPSGNYFAVLSTADGRREVRKVTIVR